MRSSKQLKLREGRAAIANELLAWLKEKNLSEGSKAYESIILPFAKEKNYEVYEVWRGWGLLSEAARRDTLTGPRWVITRYDPIELDGSGDVKKNKRCYFSIYVQGVDS